jgi:hypothetical protein
VMNTSYMLQSRMGQTSCRVPTPQEAFPSLRLCLCVVQVLALSLFMLCPMWASLSLQPLSALPQVSQDCLPYNPPCAMPVSLLPMAVLLVMLLSLWCITACRQTHVFRASNSGVLARAPPLT